MITWKIVNPSAGPSYYKGYIGKNHMFGIRHDMTDTRVFVLTCVFDSGKGVYRGSLDEMKTKAEEIWNQWFKNLELPC